MGKNSGQSWNSLSFWTITKTFPIVLTLNLEWLQCFERVGQSHYLFFWCLFLTTSLAIWVQLKYMCPMKENAHMRPTCLIGLAWLKVGNAKTNTLKSCTTTTLNIPIGEGGSNSSHTRNLAKSQSYQGLKLLLSDTKFMTRESNMLIYHRFQEKQCMLVISARHMLVNE